MKVVRYDPQQPATATARQQQQPSPGTAGPATLGLRLGAPILPVGVYFTPQYNGHFAIVRPPRRLDEPLGFGRGDVGVGGLRPLRLGRNLAAELPPLPRRVAALLGERRWLVDRSES